PFPTRRSSDLWCKVLLPGQRGQCGGRGSAIERSVLNASRPTLSAALITGKRRRWHSRSDLAGSRLGRRLADYQLPYLSGRVVGGSLRSDFGGVQRPLVHRLMLDQPCNILLTIAG